MFLKGDFFSILVLVCVLSVSGFVGATSQEDRWRVPGEIMGNHFKEAYQCWSKEKKLIEQHTAELRQQIQATRRLIQAGRDRAASLGCNEDVCDLHRLEQGPFERTSDVLRCRRLRWIIQFLKARLPKRPEDAILLPCGIDSPMRYGEDDVESKVGRGAPAS